nr:MAG TPA: hypothetical protein [Bacteriophage sp.]
MTSPRLTGIIIDGRGRLTHGSIVDSTLTTAYLTHLKI